ncbi:putative cytosolic oligopeptidase A [Hypsibius exemplaris]|uniref:oligopeptidase A n=1 Tax=Hypsibius exemplaris TaxID=2072580 RepID=A0A1W0WVQ9_HYPEX|nr:putative cytosolic oligopeptidase A [Hypsibius exemplaris]
MRFRRHARLLVMCVRRELQRTPQRTFSSSRVSHNGYYLLLPAVPPDTEQSNPLLRTDREPQYDIISDKNVLSGLGKIAINYESAFYQLEEDIKKSPENATFEAVFDPLDRLNHTLVHAFTTAKTLSCGKTSPQLEDALLQSEQAVYRCRCLPNSSQTLFKAVKEIAKQRDLSEPQKRVVSRALLEARLNGAELSQQDHNVYQSILATLSEKQQTFRSRLVKSSAQFSSSILNPAAMEEAPLSVLGRFGRDPADSTRMSVTLKTPVYDAFMMYCRDSKMRRDAWQAFVGRAGFRDADLNNSLIIEDIRLMRSKEAKLFGYENYAELSMETKMARSVKHVMTSLSELTLPSKVKCQSDLVELQDFANKSGFNEDLQLWDMAYWRRKQREATFQISESEVQSYFQYPVILEQLFQLCKDLFNVTIKESNGALVWHRDVKRYQIFDEDDREIAGFYLDPYARPGQKGLMPRLELGQSKSVAAGSLPLASLLFSFQPPNASNPSLLTYEDVNVFFEKFGSSMQHLLTTMPYGDISGTNNVEWDALHVCGSTMRMLLQSPVVLKRLSRHIDTGKEIPDDLVRRLYQSEKHLSSLDLLSEMYFGILDLSLYTKTDFWLDITKDVWRNMMPFALDKRDSHPCGFAHIFIGPYAAGYYTFLWSEMVAADVFAAFGEAGFTNDKALRQTGKLFRDTFLSLGGGCHSAEVFRRFRGRDPSPQALLRLYDIV